MPRRPPTPPDVLTYPAVPNVLATDPYRPTRFTKPRRSHQRAAIAWCAAGVPDLRHQPPTTPYTTPNAATRPVERKSPPSASHAYTASIARSSSLTSKNCVADAITRCPAARRRPASGSKPREPHADDTNRRANSTAVPTCARRSTKTSRRRFARRLPVLPRSPSPDSKPD